MSTAVHPGIRKAAILVATLDTGAVDALLDQMDPQQARQVRDLAVELDGVDPQERQQVLAEFARMGGRTAPASSKPSAARPYENEREAMAEDDPSLNASKPRPSGGKPLDLLQQAESDRLARVLADERPQTIALVLSRLPAEQAGRVLSRLSAPLQTDVVRRLVDLEETDPEILADVENAIASRLAKQMQVTRRRMTGLPALVGILEACGGEVGEALLDNLIEHDRELADRLAPRVRFADFERLDEVSLAEVFRAATPGLAGLALLGANPRLIQRVLRRLPASEATQVRSELERPGPVRLSDVDTAREELAQVARRLVMQGRVRIGIGD